MTAIPTAISRLTALCIAMVAVVTALPAVAQVTGIEITERGIYAGDVATSARGSHGVGQTTSTNIRLSVSTDHVPVQYGIRFGITYRVLGAPDGQYVELRKVIVFPPQGLHNSATNEAFYRDESTIGANIGRSSYTGYILTDPWEMVPGPWRIELWYGDQMLASQTFTLSGVQ